MRFNRLNAKARRARYHAALARPELRRSDSLERSSPSTPIGWPIKRNDPETQALIDQAVRRMKLAANRDPSR